MSDRAPTNVAQVSNETLTGERVGRDVVVDAGHVRQEALLGERVGRTVVADVGSMSQEALAGERVGRNVVADISHALIEVVMKEPALTVASVAVESLVSLPDEPVAPRHLVPQAFQWSVQWKETLPASQMVSPISVSGVVTAVIGGRKVAMHISEAIYSHAHLSAVLSRAVTPAPEHISPLSLRHASTLVTLSRDRAYQPRSEVVVRSTYAAATIGREMIAPADRHSPINAASTMTLVTAKAHRPMPEGGIWSTQVQQRITHAREMPAAYGGVVAGQTVSLSTQWRDRTLPASATRIGSSSLMVVQKRDVIAPGPYAQVASNAQLIAQGRKLPLHTSPLRYSTLTEQITLQRVGPMPESYRILGSEWQMAAQHRDTPHPDQVAGTNYAQAVTQSSQRKRLPSPLQVSSMSRTAAVRVIFNQRRTVPRPEEVIDPSVGTHVAEVRVLATQRRVTEPPNADPEARRNLYAYAEVAVLKDKGMEPPPDEPIDIASAQVRGLMQTVVVADDAFLPMSWVHLPALRQPVVISDNYDWLDPWVPLSDAAVNHLYQFTLLDDTSLPPSDQPRSETRAILVAQRPLIQDRYPDPSVPNSEVALPALSETPVLADTSLPPGDQPRVDAVVPAVAEAVAVADSSLPPGDEPLSAAMVGELTVTPVLADHSLPPGDRPLSAITVAKLGQGAVLGDTSLPPGDQPLSVAHINRVAQSAALADQTISGVMAGSEVGSSVVAQYIVLADLTMHRSPKRPAGKRPIISISIS